MSDMTRDTRSLSRETTEHLELACGWQPLTSKPPAIAHLTASAIDKLRTSDDMNAAHLVTAWNEWAFARSFSVADNIGRMRSVLHLLRYWRRIQRQDPSDQEAHDAVQKVWAFARDHWGIVTPPTDARRWDAYCEDHVMTMAKRKEGR